MKNIVLFFRDSNRETAFVHAIVSAGIAHTVTRNCSRGDFADCVCDRRNARYGNDGNMGWKMGGCSDNINFGTQVAQQFLDSSGKYTASKKCFCISELLFYLFFCQLKCV